MSKDLVNEDGGVTENSRINIENIIVIILLLGFEEKVYKFFRK